MLKRKICEGCICRLFVECIHAAQRHDDDDTLAVSSISKNVFFNNLNYTNENTKRKQITSDVHPTGRGSSTKHDALHFRYEKI